MKLRIVLASTRPPSGMVGFDEEATLPFDSWLELLRALDALTAATPCDTVRESPTARTVRTLHTLGREEQARSLAESALASARRQGDPTAVGRALRLRASVAVDHADALAHLEEAVGVLRPAGDREDLAHALVERGAALRRTNRRVEARKALLEGRDLAVVCQDTALAAHAEEELLVSAGRLQRGRGWGTDVLTPAERRTAELAADGLGNPEIARRLFLSRRTVENQLSRAYRKLGIAAREELQFALGSRNGAGLAPRSRAA